MAFRRETYAPFNGFYVVIGAASPGDKRTFNISEQFPVTRLVSRALYCDPFLYLPCNVVMTPGMMSHEYTEDRMPGKLIMTPEAKDKDSFYLNAFRNGWDGDLCSGKPVEILKSVLEPGEEYVVQQNQAVMLGVGEVEVKRALTTRAASAPAVIDARICGVTIVAKTRAVIAEVWV